MASIRFLHSLPFIFGRIEVLIYRYIKHCDHLIKGVEAWMLTIIFIIHNGTRSAVNNIGQLLLCHAAGFSCTLDGEPISWKSKRLSSRSIFITSPDMILHFMWYYLNDYLFHTTDYLISHTQNWWSRKCEVQYTYNFGTICPEDQRLVSKIKSEILWGFCDIWVLYWKWRSVIPCEF